MDTFKNLKSLGYNKVSHLSEEELDLAQLTDNEKFIEIRLALRWFESAGFYYSVIPYISNNDMLFLSLIIDGAFRFTNDSFKTSVEAELNCLDELIKRKKIYDSLDSLTKKIN